MSEVLDIYIQKMYPNKRKTRTQMGVLEATFENMLIRVCYSLNKVSKNLNLVPYALCKSRNVRSGFYPSHDLLASWAWGQHVFFTQSP